MYISHSCSREYRSNVPVLVGMVREFIQEHDRQYTTSGWCGATFEGSHKILHVFPLREHLSFTFREGQACVLVDTDGEPVEQTGKNINGAVDVFTNWWYRLGESKRESNRLAANQVVGWILSTRGCSWFYGKQTLLSPISVLRQIKGSFSCKRRFSLLNFERGLKKKTMGCLILKLYIVIILY